jgi:hypothetical protein
MRAPSNGVVIGPIDLRGVMSGVGRSAEGSGGQANSVAREHTGNGRDPEAPIATRDIELARRR